uniref:Autophagy-related protein n=1 Tax=Noctiluca scintillans TaxID=2966 RepID=A0A7S1FF80_NOCSC
MAEEPFEKRSTEATRIRAKYPDRIPVICERSARSCLPDMEKKKFLVPGSMLCGEFKYIVHKHLSQGGTPLSSDQTIFLFVGSTSPKTGALMSEVYEQYKSQDGFLYITYSAENTLGSGDGDLWSIDTWFHKIASGTRHQQTVGGVGAQQRCHKELATC